MSDILARAKRAMKRLQERNEQERWIYGTVGRLVDGVPVFDVTGRSGYLYVTIRQANGAQTSVPARNDGSVPKALGLPVRMRLEGRTLVIDSIARRDDLAYTNPAQQGNIHTHDNRYFTEVEHVVVSAGAGDAGKPVKLDAGGKLDVTLLDGVDIATLTHAATGKTTPVDADELGIADSAASFVLKKLTWANLKATLKTYLDTLYVWAAGKAGGQTIYGGTGASENLTLQSTAHATKGELLLPDNIITYGNGTTFLIVQFDGAAGNARDFRMQSAGVDRIFLGLNSMAEGGSNAGSDFNLRTRTDAGASLDNNALYLKRADSYFGLGIFPLAKSHVLQPTLGSAVQRLQSTSAADDPTQDFLQGRVGTTNATVTTLFTMAIPASTACLLEAFVVARRTGGAAGTAEDCAAYVIRGLFNQVAGAANIVGQTQNIIGESQAGWDCVFDVNGTDARVRVTGAASNNISWHAHAFHRPLSS